MARPRKYKIELTDEQLEYLKSVIRKKDTCKTIRCRCQILIDLDNRIQRCLLMNSLQSRMVYLCRQ